MSRKLDLVMMKERNNKLEFKLQHQQESHYQCLSATNQEEPEQFMNASRKQETEPELLEPEVYVNIAHAKKEAQPSLGLCQETDTADTDKDAPTPTPTPAVSSHRRAMEILKTYIKAEPVTRSAAGSDTESWTEQKSPRLAVGQNRNHTDTAGNLQSVASSSKEKSKNMSLLFLTVVCCVLVVFLVFTLLLTFIGLNRSELMKNEAEGSHSTATSNMLIMNLTKQVRDLQESLNEMKMQTNTAITNLNAQSIMLLANFTIHEQNSEVSLRDLEERLSALIDSHISRVNTANTNLQLMINSHVDQYSSLVSTSENNYSRLATRISGNYVNLSDRITHLQDSVYSKLQLQSRVNLESRCSKSPVSCTVSGSSSVYYQLSCSTPRISRTNSVSHTCQQ